MKKSALLLTTIFLLTICCKLQAQSNDAQMDAWKAYMTPGEIHKMMAKDVGKWKAEVTSWMSPDAPPSKSTAECVDKMILGGRYLHQTFTGNFMGQPFEGIGTIGYDNAKKMFVSSWVDNFGTGMMYMEGPWDDATKSITFKGKCVDPMSGGDMECRQVMKFIDDKTQMMEMYMTQAGKEMKTMEIKFTKQ